MLIYSSKTDAWEIDTTIWRLVHHQDEFIKKEFSAYGDSVQINPIFEALSCAFELAEFLSRHPYVRDQRFIEMIEEVLETGKFHQHSDRYENFHYEARLVWCLKYFNERVQVCSATEFSNWVVTEASRFLEMLHWRAMASNERANQMNTDIEIISGNTVLKGSSSKSHGEQSTDSAADISKLYHSEMFKIANDFRLCRENNTLPWWGCSLIFLLSLLSCLILQFAEITKIISIKR